MSSSGTPEVQPGDMSLEVVVIPVSDVDRAKEFYATTLGFHLHADFTAADGLRIVQVTPPGSRCSINFGAQVTAAAPGSAQGMILVVRDVEAARANLVSRGVEVSDVFHDVGGLIGAREVPEREAIVQRVAGETVTFVTLVWSPGIVRYVGCRHSHAQDRLRESRRCRRSN